MAKFIKFSVRNSAAASPLGPTENILVNLEDNPIVSAIRSAMTANPGGVVASAQLGVDQAATPAQMYWRTATFA